jgi:hypothetical protein
MSVSIQGALPYLRASLAAPNGPYTALVVAKMTPAQVIDAASRL